LQDIPLRRRGAVIKRFAPPSVASIVPLKGYSIAENGY
jgi:hypothetical protein